MNARRAVMVATLVAGVLLGATASAATTGSASPESGATIPRRVLIVSLPTVSFEDVNHAEMPNLRRLLDASAIGDLTLRGTGLHISPISGYVTLGAGTRARGAGPLDGWAFNTTEVVGGVSAAELYRQRTGIRPADGVVHLGFGAIVNANAAQPFDADVGALGSALAEHGWRSAVIGNADTVDQTSGTPIYHREVAAGLVDHEGFVPGKDVSADLLLQDPDAPFGERLDPAAVDRRFAEVWRPRSVVMVEGSDLNRLAASLQTAAPQQAERLQAATLRWTDQLVGRLMRRVDPSRDAVLVVAPANKDGPITTLVTGVRAPGWSPGLLDSSTTRRAGFVQLVDVAPTVLGLLGIERPGSMEGRSYEVASTAGTPEQRREYLEAVDRDSQFRDSMLVSVHVVFLVVLALALLGAVGMVLRPAVPWFASVALGGTFGVLAYFPAVLGASLFDLRRPGAVAYWAFVVAVGAAVAGVLAALARRWDVQIAVMVGLALIVAVIGGDVLTGSNLEWNSTLGYSATGAGRFTGMGNLCYAAFSAAGLMLGVLIVDRFGRRWAPAVVVLFAAMIVVNGAPMWGSDVGGILSLVPAFGVTGWFLLGGRIRARTLAVCTAVAAVVVAVATALDLLRPADSRTQLGRLAETYRNEGFDGVWTVISRKAELNVNTWGTTVLQIAIPLVLAFGFWLWWRHRDRLSELLDLHPLLGGGTIGLGVLVVLGYALNDSGVAIPGVMLGVAGAVLVGLLVHAERLRSGQVKAGGSGLSPVPVGTVTQGGA